MHQPPGSRLPPVAPHVVQLAPPHVRTVLHDGCSLATEEKPTVIP